MADRVIAAAVNDNTELFFIFDREAGQPEFTARERRVLYQVMLGLGGLTRQMGILYGGGGTDAHRLTPRERDTVRALLQGLPDDETAEKLGITPASLRQYCSRCCRKLKVRGRAALFAYWFGCASHEQSASSPS